MRSILSNGTDLAVALQTKTIR